MLCNKIELLLFFKETLIFRKVWYNCVQGAIQKVLFLRKILIRMPMKMTRVTLAVRDARHESM